MNDPSGIEDSLQCGVCFEKFGETGQHIPLIIACGHTFCNTCIVTLREKNCPFCMQSFQADITSLPRNLTLLSLISGFNSLLASQNHHQSQQQQLPHPPPTLPAPSPKTICSSSSNCDIQFDPPSLTHSVSDSNQRKPLISLSIEEVQSLLESTNLNRFKVTFLENEVDGETLFECHSPEDLKDLGITFMPKCRAFFNKLEEYRIAGGVPLKDVALSNSNSNISASSSGSSSSGSSSTDSSSSSNDSSCNSNVEKAPPSASFSPVLPLSSRLNPVAISGVMGPLAKHINGVYDPILLTVKWRGGKVCCYKMRSQDVYLEYNIDREHWHVKPRTNIGTTHAWMYISSTCIAPDCIPHEVMMSSVHVWDGDKFSAQRGVSCERQYASVLIAGCVGSAANEVNGVFEPAEEMCGGWTRYQKRGNISLSLEYCAAKSRWQIKAIKDKGSAVVWAYLPSPLVCAPDKAALATFFPPANPISPSQWHCYDPSTYSFTTQPSVVTIEEPNDVVVHGATIDVNGQYKVTSEVCDGFIRYYHDTKSLCMEYNLHKDHWQIKSIESSGTTNVCAYGDYTHPISPASPPPTTTWHSLSAPFDDLSSIKECKLCIIPFHGSGGGGGRLNVTVGNDVSLGQVGIGNVLTGVYEMSGVADGWHFYEKIGGGIFLEYCSEKKQWQLKPHKYKGTATAWACVGCSETRSPLDLSPELLWQLYDPNAQAFAPCSSLLITAAQ